jgi:hypothetical protein
MNIGGVWKSIKSGYINTGTWQQFFLRVATPVNTVKPVVTGSTYLYGTLSGTLGTWTAPNGTNSYARQWQRADYDGSSTPGTFSSISGATSSTYTTTIDDNGKWIRLRVTATNLSGSDTAFSELDYISKYSPVALTIPVISGSASVGSTLTALTTVGTYWKNTTTNSGDTAPDSFSYRWYWGNTGDNIGSNSSTYLVQNTDVGNTIRVDVTATNTGGSTTSTSAQTSTVGQQIGISNISFKDSNDNNGFNNRGNLVTATTTKLSWKVSGVNTSTTFRVRYRVFNNQTSAYWNPDSVTATTASLSWVEYVSDYYNNGGISNVSISGSDAYLYDFFAINETFNGSTYGGGISKWTWEYEISAVIGGTRYYWVPGDSVSTSFTFDYWDIDPTSLGSISASPTSVATGTSVTFSGTISSYPSGLNTYPYAYRVVYGDGNNSGWIYPLYGTNKPTYSLSHSYSSTGSYTAYVETIPEYSSSSASVTVENAVIPTVTIASNTGVSSTAGTINWTSTNQAKYSVSGTFAVAETTSSTARSVSKTGLTASTTYTGTITVKSSTGNTATADYSLATDAAPPAPVASVTSMTGSTGGRTGTSTWNNPKATITFNFANTNSATVRIQRSVDNSTWDSGAQESFTGSPLNSATISTNQPVGTTAAFGNYYYRGQVTNLNGTSLVASPITSASFRNTVTPINSRAIYP